MCKVRLVFRVLLVWTASRYQGSREAQERSGPPVQGCGENNNFLYLASAWPNGSYLNTVINNYTGLVESGSCQIMGSFELVLSAL